MPNSKLYNIKTTLTDGTVIDSGTIEVPQGEKGDNGLSALECSYTIDTTMSPVVGEGVINIPEDNFNRDPVVGDIAMYTWKNGLTGQSYIVSGKCTVSNPGAAKSFQTVSFVETTGTGKQLYTHQVIIKSTSPVCTTCALIINDKQEQFTQTTFINTQLNSSMYSATGYYTVTGGTSYPIYCMYLSGGTINVNYVTDGGTATFQYSNNGVTFSDRVTAL